MAYIRVNIKSLKDYRKDINKVKSDINNIKNSVVWVGFCLDADVKWESNISGSFNSIDSELESICYNLERMRILLESAESQYRLVIDKIDGMLEIIPMTEKDAKVERQKISKGINTAVTIAGVVAGIGATILFGPVGIVVTSAVVSVISTTTKHLCESYVETGTVGISDWGEYFKDAGVGLVVSVGLSAASSAIGCIGGEYIDEAVIGLRTLAKTVGGAASRVTSSVLLNIGIKVFEYSAKAALAVGTKVSIGAMERSVKAFGDGIYKSINNGDGYGTAIKNINNSMTRSAADDDEIVKDVFSGLADTVGDAVDEGLGSSVLLDDLYSPKKSTRIIANAEIGVAKKMVTGVVERSTHSITDQARYGSINVKSVLSDTFDIKKMGMDVIGGFADVKDGINTSFSDGMAPSDRERYLKSMGY